MPSVRELVYLARDFWGAALGRDYFHRLQMLGLHWKETRCYYNDLRHKADWTGKSIDGVPAVFIPAWNKHVQMPVTVLQYGLGSMDRYFTGAGEACLANVRAVATWIHRQSSPEGFFDIPLSQLDPQHRYHSNNCAMALGEALSFCARAIQYRLVDEQTAEQLESAAQRILTNMLTPVEERGTALYRGDDVYLCEFCRTDDYVVLNGWIFAVFGLIDWLRFRPDEHAQTRLDATIATMRRSVTDFILPNGWSYYDNKGLICSPFYHHLHISLLDAMFRLTRHTEFGQAQERLARAFTPCNRLRYTATRVLSKLRDRYVYLGSE